MRKARQLSLVELGEKSGLSFSHLSRYERGVTKPSADGLQRLSEALQVSVAGLMDDDAPMQLADPVTPLVAAVSEPWKSDARNVANAAFTLLPDPLAASDPRTTGAAYWCRIWPTCWLPRILALRCSSSWRICTGPMS